MSDDKKNPDETTQSRFLKTLNGQMPADRLPVWEMMPWWDLTVKRWKKEGLPAELEGSELKRYFNLDLDYRLRVPQMTANESPSGILEKFANGWRITDEKDYEAVLPHLYPATLACDRNAWQKYAAEHALGTAIVWVVWEGFFWWPRKLFGIEAHLYAFYDQPDLMHRFNRDQVSYLSRHLDDFCSVCVPDFVVFAEDMSYNHGPMISKRLFDEFIAPYYRQIIPRLKKRGIIPLLDSDGDVEPLIPWFEEIGMEGILPLECRAGVDVKRIRSNHPAWKMLGGFDKTVMHLGEERMRLEFERLLPVMRSGYFITSVDHQTPPEVSLDDYRLYLRLLREYAAKAVV